MKAVLGRFVAIALAASAAFTGCVASNDGVRTPMTVASERVAPDPQLAELAAAPTTLAPTTTVAASPASVPARSVSSPPRARVNRSTGDAAAARTSPQAGVAWAHYNGQLTGGTYYVARVLGASVEVSPAPDTAPAAALSNPLQSGAPRVLVVVADPGGDWLQVLLPMRPNSSVGWVRRVEVDVTTVHYRAEIDRAAHRVRVFDGSENLVADEPAAVGKSSTPTPAGQFFTVELLQPSNPRGDYGPYAFTLSAYSDVYQTFGSGDGAVGMHGTNEPSSIGRDASHGCVRLQNAAIQRLAGMLPLGTPVFIR